jgi:hypothetical protein
MLKGEYSEHNGARRKSARSFLFRSRSSIVGMLARHKVNFIVAVFLLCVALLLPTLLLHSSDETSFAPSALAVSVEPESGTGLPEGTTLNVAQLSVTDGERVLPGGVAVDPDFLYDTLVAGDVTVLDVDLRPAAPAIFSSAEKFGGGGDDIKP